MILLDANVLVYALDAAAPQHADCREVLRSGTAGRLPAVLLPQVLLECYAVITSPKRVSRPLASEQAAAALRSVRSSLEVKSVPEEVLDELDEILEAAPRVGPAIFDLFLVAQMRGLRIAEVCTYDKAGFALPGVTALSPPEALARYEEGEGSLQR